ncbi:efflux RND transporter periplasmic adaptor subunit [Salidesulfovibrio brasiliensis]
MKRIITSVLLFLLAVTPAFADKPEGGGPPPAVVVTAKVTAGKVAPQTEYVGTVFFSEQSSVAAEIEGKVVEIPVNHGSHVNKGDVLVQLSTDIIDRKIANARALMNQARADYETARLEGERVSKLFDSKSVAKGEYDNKRLGAEAAQMKFVASRAIMNRLQLEKEKKTIRAPFDGIVLERTVSRGEWVGVGTVVTEMGRDDEYDVECNVPARASSVIQEGLEVVVRVSDREIPGKVYAVIPKGDVSTRTFPIKIRVKSPGFLAEGMEARVALPSAPAGKTLIVPRDAVISSRGQMVVWAVVDGKAVPMPVRVTGFKDLEAGVTSEKLQEGMTVVVKGNERLRPGQPVAPKPQTPSKEQ